MSALDTRLAAVLADPDDEAARLAFADAVEATDRDRAAFIRIQIELARARKKHVRLERALELLTREGDLTEQHDAAWSANVAALVEEWLYRRGFVEQVTLDASAFLARAPELYRRAPILHLDLTGAARVVDELFASAHLERIQSLSLRANALGDEAVAALARSPHLGQLAWLDLADNQIGIAGVEALAASRSLPRLGYVRLAYNRLEDPTPRHADEWDATSELGAELQRKYGPRAWLDARERPVWPPERDAVG